MNTTTSIPDRRLTVRCIILGSFLSALVVACGSGASGSTSPSPVDAVSSLATGAATPSETGVPADSSSPDASTITAESQAPDTGGGTTGGDVPDNAVFLTYQQASLGFSIQYVEGWQVTTQADGVLIHDKDSSESVSVVPLPSDIAAYITSTDLPALQGQAGFKLSLFGYEPQLDYQAIVKDQDGRRIDRKNPQQSLILRKPTFAIPHGGGERFKAGSLEYNGIVEWIRPKWRLNSRRQ
jgi:hypothetical protein